MPENIGHVIQVAGPPSNMHSSRQKCLPSTRRLGSSAGDGFTVPTPINVILEVQRHLGEGRVRCVAMQPTDGMVPA